MVPFPIFFSYFPAEGLGRPKPVFFLFFSYFGPEARNLFCSRPTGLQDYSSDLHIQLRMTNGLPQVAGVQACLALGDPENTARKKAFFLSCARICFNSHLLNSHLLGDSFFTTTGAGTSGCSAGLKTVVVITFLENSQQLLPELVLNLVKFLSFNTVILRL